jgi:hypothetical protein
MAVKRPYGIKFIAYCFALRSLILIVAAAIGCVDPELRAGANDFIWHFAPWIKEADLVQFGIVLAPLMAIYDAVVGLGLWFLNRWVRAWVIVSFMYWVAYDGVKIMMNRTMSSSSALNSAPYFAFEFAISVLIFGYLFVPDVRSAFGLRSDEDDDWWRMFSWW